MSDPAEYTVGWICAIDVEYVAAQEFLDEEHEGPTFVSPNDTNDYTLGKICQHNVVIAVLPDGEYGTASAASVATNMLNSFPNVKIGLMVGIGGGVPSERHDIRLGDVVVSASSGGSGEGGVFQYDFGKSIQGQGFQYTRFLNQAPATLRTAITGIRAQYKRKGHQLEEAVNGLIDRNQRLSKEFRRPPPYTDKLFKPEIVCYTDSSNIILRPERSKQEDNPAVHYGLIASANQLMKDALIRDRLAAEKNVLCFEMEAAGLMNQFPCLVIRGICDYSDSHKNKVWQGYAAMVAAAFAKDILRRVSPSRIEAEVRIKDLLSGLQDIAEAHRSIAQEHLEVQKDIAQQTWSKQNTECLQLFRLTAHTGSTDTTYEWYKDRVGARAEGTCKWFLEHKNFQMWAAQDSGLLLVSADPGCGKSVLAKYLIDDILPHSNSATICYFFFKDHDQNTIRQALCALLHQLFSKKVNLIKHAMEEFQKNGQGLINSTNSLWTVLRNSLEDAEAGSVVLVLDALDECTESDFEDLIRNVKGQFRRGQSKTLKCLLTSRPYEQITDKFRGLLSDFPYIRIPGEDESEKIAQEVRHVIQYRVDELAREKGLPDKVVRHLIDRLLRVTHRTYLWVYLVFDYLKSNQFKKTPNGIDRMIETLPSNVNEAYEQILNRSRDQAMVRRALRIMLAASRPLTIPEMNIALNINGSSKSFHDLDLENEEDFKSHLRTGCGLFVSIHYDRIYFLHQTAREFLVTNTIKTGLPSALSWQGSIDSKSAHKTLAEVCVVYLNFFNRLTASAHGKEDPIPHHFKEYASNNWGSHFYKAYIRSGADLVPLALNICSPDSRSWLVWYKIYSRTTWHSILEGFTAIMISSYFGLEAVVEELLLEKDPDIESRDNTYDRTPISWAAYGGHEIIVRLLIQRGAVYDSRDKLGRTPLSLAAEGGHETVVRLLLDRAVISDSRDGNGRTPLSFAVASGHENIVRLLLDRGVVFDSQDEDGRTPLSFAAEYGRENIVELLLEKDVKIGNENIVRWLLDKGAVNDSQDQNGHTPIFLAAGLGHESVAKLLLEKGVVYDSQDKQGRTPLSVAVEYGRETMVRLLLDKGVSCDTQDETGWTPLHLAAERGYETIVRLLLDKGVEIDSKDAQYGQTPLFLAARNGYFNVSRLLFDKGAAIESQDRCFGSTPLSRAAENGHENIVKLLVKRGANTESKDRMAGRTPLLWAANNGHNGSVQVLLENGAVLQSQDRDGLTPLCLAARSGHEKTVQLLVERGAIIDWKGAYGRTPIYWAAHKGHRNIVKLLLSKIAAFDLGGTGGTGGSAAMSAELQGN
ncbi:hypothetical protein N7466_004715 [Penicillium verhagenii]|uniref:uncharacterized protein n=1 Tax=Penicillium verhagenii TaxID=1562060 RepID=UPI0025456E91|nr:uncharacterized protein N7466_004715 [Penicillium verhagenii]KAJ5935168.1 hypothetical protein N7466_004715 [Penicillium verhagenii]